MARGAVEEEEEQVEAARRHSSSRCDGDAQATGGKGLVGAPGRCEGRRSLERAIGKVCWEVCCGEKGEMAILLPRGHALMHRAQGVAREVVHPRETWLADGNEGWEWTSARAVSGAPHARAVGEVAHACMQCWHMAGRGGGGGDSVGGDAPGAAPRGGAIYLCSARRAWMVGGEALREAGAGMSTRRRLSRKRGIYSASPRDQSKHALIHPIARSVQICALERVAALPQPPPARGLPRKLVDPPPRVDGTAQPVRPQTVARRRGFLCRHRTQSRLTSAARGSGKEGRSASRAGRAARAAALPSESADAAPSRARAKGLGRRHSPRGGGRRTQSSR
eukprot:364806-Chlamydomonas_euryale.AAC.16